MGADTSAVEWLMASPEPAVRRLTRRDVLGEPTPSDDDADVRSGPWVQALLSGRHPDGASGVGWYRKWTGAHWRMVQLVELEVPPGEPAMVAAVQTILDDLVSPRRRVAVVDGLARVHASVEGNALAVCSRIGMGSDGRVRQVAHSLIEWQWPDGGWNCDSSASGRRSSFHESLSTMWGLFEYGRVADDREATAAARRTAELFLEHRLFRRLGDDGVIDPRWLRPCYPSYWHYDIGRALLVLARMGLAGDPRAADALGELEARRSKDGRWVSGAQWWKPGGGSVTPEVVDWGRAGQPNRMITLNALRVLRSAGRSGVAAGPLP